LVTQQQEIDALAKIINERLPTPESDSELDTTSNEPIILDKTIPEYIFGSNNPVAEKVLSVKWFVLSTPLLVKKGIIDCLRDVSCQGNGIVNPSTGTTSIPLCSNRSTQKILDSDRLYYFKAGESSTTKV